MENEEYLNKQEEDFAAHELKCSRCGACCGANDKDPCINLEKVQSGKYYCKIYENRIGRQKTISGREFSCIPIRDLTNEYLLSINCVYARTK